MSLIKTWYTPEDAQSKSGVDKGKILEWVEEGLVRSERGEGGVMLVNIDDIQLQSESLLRES